MYAQTLLYELRGNIHIVQYYEILTFRSFFDQNFCNPKPLTQLNPDPGQRIIYKSVLRIYEFLYGSGSGDPYL